MSIKVKGDSMVPFLKPMDEVKLKIVPAKTIRMGDIVMYYEKQSHIMVIHRIVGKRKNGYLVKGDNNWCMDSVRLDSKKFFVLKEIVYENKIWRTDTTRGKFVNKIFWILSVLRVFPFIHRRRMVCK